MKLVVAVTVAVVPLVAGCVHSDAQPGSSPRGYARHELIAFASNRDGDLEIYTTTPDGSTRRQLTRNASRGRNEADDKAPAWSPDGRWLAFMSTRDHQGDGIDSEEIYVMRADGADERRLTRNLVPDLAPDWTAEGKVAFWRCRKGIADCSLLAVPPGGGEEERLYQSEDVVTRSALSPDGALLAVGHLHARTDSLRPVEIRVIDLATGGERTLTDNDASDAPVAWSPDGSRLLFLSGRDRNGDCLFHDCEGFKHELYVMAADGSDERRLTRSDLAEAGAAWSPRGRRIAFSATGANGAETRVYVMNVDGTCVTSLIDGDANTMPDWYGPPRARDAPLSC